MAQADAILQVETRRAKERVMRHGLSEPALSALDYIYGRLESPADRLLRSPRTVVELRGVADFCARQRRRRALVRRFQNAHVADARDHSRSRDR